MKQHGGGKRCPADGADADAIADQAITNDRVILVAPGYFVPNPADPEGTFTS